MVCTHIPLPVVIKSLELDDKHLWQFLDAQPFDRVHLCGGAGREGQAHPPATPPHLAHLLVALLTLVGVVPFQQVPLHKGL